MVRALHKLTADRIRKLPQPAYTKLHGDGGGLYVQTSPSGGRSWLFRYTYQGAERSMGLGRVDTANLANDLAAARRKAADARLLLKQGVDPLTDRETQRAALAPSNRKSFKDCAEAYLSEHEASWKNPIHRAQWCSTLASYVYPKIGTMDVQAVDVDHVKDILEPIWRDKAETARRVRGRVQAILDYATAHKYRTGENPARMAIVRQLLGKTRKRVVSHAAMPYPKLPVFMLRLQQRDGLPERALAFLILTATRSTETRAARWDEIDTEKRVWAIPADRMKGGQQHRVPLSSSALTIIEKMRQTRRSDYVFPGQGSSYPISDTAIRNVLRDLGYKRGQATPHGMRSSFRDWCAEQTTFPDRVAEAALAHAIPDKTEAAYLRTKYFDQRVLLMEQWADFLGY